MEGCSWWWQPMSSPQTHQLVSGCRQCGQASVLVLPELSVYKQGIN